MTLDALKARFPNASEAFLRRNAHETDHHRPLQDTEPEPPLCHDALGPASGEEASAGRSVVRITSYRHRLLDSDNLAGGCKYLIDALRYANLIKGDSPDQITLTVSQQKCAQGEERTVVEIER